MPDIIRLLPDSVANQIAAGEVIQRPASAVKELLENSIDSGGDEIKLVIKDAGKQLIQVIDNGCGMSETDARMCFERHATSKITTADDLFAIKTLGFRGEALASMAAIAHLEMKTKKVEEELGTCINIAGTIVKSQEICACPDGTSILIKNLFYNVPARRKFLKSNTTELRHIIEEFQRVALVNPEIKFSFYNENRQLFLLAKSNLKQRIAALLGPAYNNRLVPVEQNSDVVNISGFIGKPEHARKTRGEQYFFVNNRFIKHPYLNHAVDNAFKELIPTDAFPTYFIYFSIDPKEIDINIHPTKTEINFQNNQVIYAMLSSAIKQALGKFNIVPSIDFDSDPSVGIDFSANVNSIKQPSVKIDPTYNPFGSKQTKHDYKPTGTTNVSGWEKLYTETPGKELKQEPKDLSQQNLDKSTIIQDTEEGANVKGVVFQIHNKYIISNVRSGLMVLDQNKAHQRILFEEYVNTLENGKGSSQQLLFPATIQFSAGDTEILLGIMNDLKVIGFDIEEFGKNSFIVNGTPTDMNNLSVKDVLENIIENFKKNLQDINTDKKVNLARSMAVNLAIAYGKKLQQAEMASLIDRLFACKAPDISPDGKPIVRILSVEELDQMF